MQLGSIAPFNTTLPMNAKRILVIDDNVKKLDTIHNILDKMRVNYTLHKVENGRDALLTLMGSSKAYVEYHTGLQKARPDIILLSTNLPDMSGAEFLEIVSKYYSLADIKIFLLAPDGTETNNTAYESFGVAGILKVPINEHELHLSDFKRLRVELGGNPIYMFFPSFIHLENTGKSVFSIIKSSLLKIKAVLTPGTYTIGAKILTGTVLTAGLGLGLANLPPEPKQELIKKTVNAAPKATGAFHLSVAEEVATIKKMYAEFITTEADQVTNSIALSLKSKKTKSAGLIPTSSESETKEETVIPSNKATDIRIGVREEKDSIPH